MRELARGLGLAAVALLTVFAGLWLALSENGNATPTPSAPSAAAPTETLYVPSPILPSRTPIDAFALLQTQAPAASPTPCPMPVGWVKTTLAQGDTWVGLAATHGLSVGALLQANCLDHDSLFVGATVYLPVTTPTLAPTPVCGPPPGWVYYTVQSGDTLFALSLRYGLSLYDLRQANCLPGTAIKAGQNLFVPPGLSIVTATLALTNTATTTLTATTANSATAPATLTSAPATATSQPTATATTANPPSATMTETATLTETSLVTATTEAPSATPSESDTQANPSDTPTTPAPTP